MMKEGAYTDYYAFNLVATAESTSSFFFFLFHISRGNSFVCNVSARTQPRNASPPVHEPAFFRVEIRSDFFFFNNTRIIACEFKYKLFLYD